MRETRAEFAIEIPTLSFDFAFTGKSVEDGDEGEADEGAKLMTLVVHDSHTGSTNCFPLRGKNDKKHAVERDGEVCAISWIWRYMLDGDQEPSVLAIQSLMQRTWQRMGFKVAIENSKVLDHGGNSLVEKSIQLIAYEQLQMYWNQVCNSIGHEIPVRHPLFSWAFCHSAWLVDRFARKANVTAYGLVRGHSYRGKLCQFGEPLMCSVGGTTNKKGGAKWRQGIFLSRYVSGAF